MLEVKDQIIAEHERAAHSMGLKLEAATFDTFMQIKTDLYSDTRFSDSVGGEVFTQL